MGLCTLNLTAPWLFLSDRASLSRRASLSDSAALRGVAPRVHKPNDPMPSQHTLLHSLFSIHQPECLRIFSTENTVHLMNRPLACCGQHLAPCPRKLGLTYTDLSGPSYSSTPADRQRGRGTLPFTSPSPVPSTSTSSKRARFDDDSPDLGLFLNSSVNTSFPSPYDEIPDDDAVESAALGPAGDLSGSQLRRGDLQGYLQPALKARVDRYIQERVADAVERAVATFEGKVDALQSRVDQLETALRQKEPVTPRRQKVDKEVSVSTYFRHCN